MIQIIIKPMDTLFFRDSKPFTAGEGTTADFNFPSPLTFFGSIGNAVLDSTDEADTKKFITAGHSKLGKYDPELKNTLLKLKGPFLYKNGNIFLPPPANLWVAKGGTGYKPYPALPYDRDGKWDIKNEHLKPLQIKKVDFEIKPLDKNKWISIEDLMKYLSGNHEVFSARSLEEFFIKEIKYGHAISRDSQTVEKGYLYTSTHIRFRDELEFKNYDETGFIIVVDGILEKDLQDNIIYLGGERREAIITINDLRKGKLIPEQPEVVQKIQASKRFFIYLATPAIFKNGWYIDLPSEFKGAELVGAAVNKPEFISGWKINENMKGEPRSIKKAAPAGSVYFFESKSWNDQKFEELYKKYNFNESLSDDYPSAGFGIGLIGSW